MSEARGEFDFGTFDEGWEAGVKRGRDYAKSDLMEQQAQLSSITRGIIADLTARDLKGQREYGTTMDRADLTPLEWLDHEYAELLDAAQYNRAARRRVEAMQLELGGMRAQLLAVLEFRDRDSSVGGFHVLCEDIEALLKGEEVAG